MVDNRQSTLNRTQQERMVQAVYMEAAQMMKSGQSSYQIAKKLMERGVPPEAARTVVDNLEHARNDAIRNQATSQMAIGGVICLIGIAVTWGTYAAASGGGTYVVAWGAIIFGGWRFLQGMMAMGNS